MKQPFILTLVSSVACAVTAANKAPENTTPTKSKTPNVVFIYADDLGYGDLECYGAKNVQTPNVNRLAKSGILFTNAHATAATSTPSRYSMLTGEYAWRKEGTDVAAGNDYPSRTIHHGRYVQKCRLHHCRSRQMASGTRRSNRHSSLECSVTVRTGRFRFRLSLHYGSHSRPCTLCIHRKRESSQL